MTGKGDLILCSPFLFPCYFIKTLSIHSSCSGLLMVFFSFLLIIYVI